MRTYLDPTAPIAPAAMLTDDPKVAMDLAVALCDSPRMSNLAHGLWGYHGTTPDGTELTVQSLGIGGPSAAAVMTDLGRLGVRRAIRIGSCIGLNGALETGASLIATLVVPGDGAGTALSDGALVPDAELTRALMQATGEPASGTVYSTDVLPGQADAGGEAVAADLSSAAFCAAGARDGIACACALVVARADGAEALADPSLDEALIALGMRAAPALSGLAQASGA